MTKTDSGIIKMLDPRDHPPSFMPDPREHPPSFFSMVLGEERKASLDLEVALYRLQPLVNQYDHALQLFDHAGNQLRQLSDARSQLQKNIEPSAFADWQGKVRDWDRSVMRFHDWRRIAAKDAAMTMRHFHYALGEIHGYRKKCPTIFTKTLRDRVKAAKKRFKDGFPDFWDIRDAAAHSYENSRPWERKKHAVNGLYVGDSVTDHGLEATFEGKLVKGELSRAKLEILQQVKDDLFLAFHDAAEGLRHDAAAALRKALQGNHTDPAP